MSYMNRVDYIIITILIVCFIIYMVSMFVFIKMDISEQRNLAKKDGYKLTSKYVIMEYELEELNEEKKNLGDSENPNSLEESEMMSDSATNTNSLGGSKLVASQNLMTDSALGITGNYDSNVAGHQKINLNKDSLEDFMEAYEISLEEKIRENQKKSVENEFNDKLFFNEDEQREILRNKKITIWDKVFTEFSVDNGDSRVSAIFDNIFITFFALTIPSLKNPLMNTNWMPLIVNNCILMTFMAARMLYKFPISFYWVLPISIGITALIFVFQHFKVYNFTVHRYICSGLGFILCFFLILDLTYIWTDAIMFFMFYFKIDDLMSIGGMRAIRFGLPSVYLILELCKVQRHMIALMYVFIYSIGVITILMAQAYYYAIQFQITIYDQFLATLNLYNKRGSSLMSVGSYFISFYVILMSFLMVIKKYKFDMSLILLSFLLLAFLIYTLTH
jgi:hypothetical protein